MTPPDDTSWRRCAREAVHALHGAVRTLRQHQGEPRLGQDAVARCTTALLAATHDRVLALQLRPGAVCLGDEVLLPFAPGEMPFGPLVEAGIGELVLACGIEAPTLEHLVATLALTTTSTEAEFDVAEQLRAADLDGVLLLAAHRRGDERDREGRAHRPDWWLLPAPATRAHALVSLVERDRETNLPAVVTELLLADLGATKALHNPPSPHLLDSLLATMLRSGDAASAAWLLEQAQHHGSVPAEVALQLRSRTIHACQGPWLLEQLELRDRLQGLLALTMQLGDGSVQRLATAAASTGRPLPSWLLEFVPPPA